MTPITGSLIIPGRLGENSWGNLISPGLKSLLNEITNTPDSFGLIFTVILY